MQTGLPYVLTRVRNLFANLWLHLGPAETLKAGVKPLACVALRCAFLSAQSALLLLLLGGLRFTRKTRLEKEFDF